MGQQAGAVRPTGWPDGPQIAAVWCHGVTQMHLLTKSLHTTSVAQRVLSFEFSFRTMPASRARVLQYKAWQEACIPQVLHSNQQLSALRCKFQTKPADRL